MSLAPLERTEPCRPCRGQGGFERGEAFDRCDVCAGSGEVVRRYCTVELLTAVPCGQRVVVVVYRHDSPEMTWGCIDGHRWLVRREAGALSWTRTADQVAAVLEVTA